MLGKLGVEVGRGGVVLCLVGLGLVGLGCVGLGNVGLVTFG